MLVQCWPTVCVAGSESKFNALCLMGCVQLSKHKTFVLHLYNVGPTSETLGRRCTNLKQMFLCLLGIAAGLVLTQCLLNVGPASPVLASIDFLGHSEYFMLPVPACWRYGPNALNQSWVNVGLPSVMLVHSELDTKHDMLTQYWANVGSAS